MLGGFGLVVAIVLFLIWKSSTKQWQRVVAWLAGGWAAISILFYGAILLQQ